MARVLLVAEQSPNPILPSSEWIWGSAFLLLFVVAALAVFVLVARYFVGLRRAADAAAEKASAAEAGVRALLEELRHTGR